PTEGWLLPAQDVSYAGINQLYWTKDTGQTWANITPPNLNGAFISGVSFIDDQHGVVLLFKLYQPFDTAYSIAQTSNGGQTWVTRTWSLFPGRGLYADYEGASLQLLDVHIGWLML